MRHTIADGQAASALLVRVLGISIDRLFVDDGVAFQKTYQDLFNLVPQPLVGDSNVSCVCDNRSLEPELVAMLLDSSGDSSTFADIHGSSANIIKYIHSARYR